MSGYRKLGRHSDARRSMLKSMVSALIVNGKIKTTETRAAEVQKIAEKLITLAVKEQNNFDTKEVTVSSPKLDAKGRKMLKTKETAAGNKYDVVERETATKMVQVDHPSRLAARRLMIANMHEFHDEKGNKINTVNHLFNEVAPKYANRDGGYTRTTKLGPRRGDAAEIVLLELI